MENSKYTLEDIGKFIADYKESNAYSGLEWTINVPFLGRKLYQKVLFENQKREIFERKYYEALDSMPQEQAKYIEQMTPVLDDFYSSRENNKSNKKQ